MAKIQNRKGKPSENRKEQEKVQKAGGVKADVLKLTAMLQDFPVPGGTQIAQQRRRAWVFMRWSHSLQSLLPVIICLEQQCFETVLLRCKDL